MPKINTISRGGSRFYVDPETGEKAPGVTSIIGMLPKPFLQHWAAKVVAEQAVDNVAELVGIALKRDRQGAIDFLKGAPRRNTSQAAETGTAVHDLFEKMAKGEPIGRVHPDYRPFVEHFEEFVKEFKPDFILLEETVWSKTHDYAGSFDAYAVVDGEKVFLDWKTTRSGVFPETALQLAAYRFADYVIRPDGTKTPQPPSTGAAVLHVRPEGWGFYPVKADEATFEYFKVLREVFRWDREVKETVVGRPLTTLPRRAAA